MLWDIALAILAFASQFVTAYVGWRVTVDGVKQERTKLYEGLFVLCGLAGIIAIAASSYRAGGVAHDLAELEAGQQKTNTGIQEIKSNPPVVNVSPPVVNVNTPPLPPLAASVLLLKITPNQMQVANGVATGLWAWLAPGQTIGINIHFTNMGPVTADVTKEWGHIYLMPSDPNRADTDKYDEKAKDVKMLIPKFKKALGQIPRSRATLAANGTNETWFSAHSDSPITQEDINKLYTGAELLFLFFSVEYKDPSGSHYIHHCQIAQTPAFNPEIWGVCDGFQDHR